MAIRYSFKLDICMCVCVEESINAKKWEIMIIHSRTDPANCNGLSKDDLSARGVIYILQESPFIRHHHLNFPRHCDCHFVRRLDSWLRLYKMHRVSMLNSLLVLCRYWMKYWSCSSEMLCSWSRRQTGNPTASGVWWRRRDAASS